MCFQLLTQNAKKSGKISPAAKRIPCYSMPNIFSWSSHIKGIACLSFSVLMPLLFDPAKTARSMGYTQMVIFYPNLAE